MKCELGTVIATEESLVKLVQEIKEGFIWEKVFKFDLEGYVCQLIKGDWYSRKWKIYGINIDIDINVNINL